MLRRALIWSALIGFAAACDGKHRRFGPPIDRVTGQEENQHDGGQPDAIDAGPRDFSLIGVGVDGRCALHADCATFDDSNVCVLDPAAGGRACDEGRGQCDRLGQCVARIVSGDAGTDAMCPGCIIDHQCVGRGELKESNVCLICDPEIDPKDWSANDGVICDDGLFCTIDDVCTGGTCIGEELVCEDSVNCNGVSNCDEVADRCSSDDNQCGLNAICDVATDRCVSTCAGCLVDGVCLPNGAELAGNPCMVCDRDRSPSGFTPAIGKSCGAGASACSQQDTCDNQGRCQPNNLAPTTPCGDSSSSPCDLPDSCDGNGNCLQRLVPSDVACDDGAFCTIGDTCQGGVCVPTGNRSCGGNQICNEAANTCQCQGCLVAGSCINSGTVNPQNSCQLCDPAQSLTAYVANTNAPCGSQTPTECSAPDTCDARAQCVPNHFSDSRTCVSEVNGICLNGECRGCDGCRIGATCIEVGAGCSVNQICAADGNCISPIAVANWAVSSASSLPVSSTAPNVIGLDLTKAPALGDQPDFGSLFAATTWPTENTTVDLTKYFQFGVTASPNHSVAYDRAELTISSNRSANRGASSWELRSSIDSFTSIVAAGSVADVASPGVAITPSLRTVGARSGTVTFRLYLFDNNPGSFPVVAGTTFPEIRGIRGPAGGASGLVIFGVVL